MNLKESYRYANFLDNLLDTSYTYLRNRAFTTTTEQVHLRSKANVDAVDETIISTKPFNGDFTPNQVIDFVVKVLLEKERLAAAISTAKLNTEINIDTSIAMNRKKQEFATVLQSMASIKPNKTVAPGSDFKFNNDGNQVKYFYNIEQTTKIDFDRNDVRALVKKYQAETDTISSKLDMIEVNTEVSFVPTWNVNDIFEDLVEAA